MCGPILELSYGARGQNQKCGGEARACNLVPYDTTETDLGKTARRLGGLRTTLLYCEHDI
jgi:hypothetical protein